MLVVESAQEMARLPKGWALTIGNFDGVHLGHRDIINATVDAARKYSAAGAAVMTFEPHPAAVLHPEKAPGILTPLPMKKMLLEKLGADCMIVLRDSPELLNLSPGDFVDDFLMTTAEPRVLIEGPNFNFGYGRSGNIRTLMQLGKERGFDVIEVRPCKIILGKAGQRRSLVCSSTLVRNLLETGDVGRARAVLGRPYRLVGKTVSGRGLGRQIGFPTANIQQGNQIVPAEGVYAGFVTTAPIYEQVCINRVLRPAVFSIGRAKTFVSEHPLLIEAHLLQKDVEDLSNCCLAMDFVERIRSQQRFENKEKLAEQIAKDCTTAKTILPPNNP